MCGDLGVAEKNGFAIRLSKRAQHTQHWLKVINSSCHSVSFIMNSIVSDIYDSSLNRHHNSSSDFSFINKIASDVQKSLNPCWTLTHIDWESN